MADEKNYIPFTQYLRPNGRRNEVTIERPKEICDKAWSIIDEGYRFEAEVLTTGYVSLTISKNSEDHAIKVINNGPDVPLAVDNMVNNFYERLSKEEGGSSDA